MSSLNRISLHIENMSTHEGDQAQKENADFAERSGLEVRVTRVYDGVGLSGGRECTWCRSRCGTNMTLDEAYKRGAFQRHPGCGCRIEYTSNRGVKTIQTGKYSGWNYANELEKRKSIGLDEGFFADELESRVDKYIGIDAKDLYSSAVSGKMYSATYLQAIEKARPQLEKAIRSHIRVTEEHEWKIRNPEIYSDRYRYGDDAEKKIVLNDWRNHRRKNARLAVIEIRIWREKFG